MHLLPNGLKVEVYRNRNKPGVVYSVRHRGKVIAHVGSIMLSDVEFVVRPAGRAKAIRTGVRNPHAFARGKITDSGMGTTAVEASKMTEFFYDVARGFHARLCTEPSILKGAMIVALNDRGAFFSYGHYRE